MYELDQQIGRHLNYLGSRVPPWHVVLPVSTTDLQRQRCMPDQRPGFQMRAGMPRSTPPSQFCTQVVPVLQLPVFRDGFV